MSGSTFVVIVNYRTGGLVVECLRSLVGEVAFLAGGRVIVVDNASGDGSVAHIAAAIQANGWNHWAEVIALPRNGGFAYGNNRAIERAAEHDPAFGAIVCLNPDTMVRPGAIKALTDQLHSNPAVGIVGASIEDEHGLLQLSAHPFPSPMGELEGAAQLGVLSRYIGARSGAAHSPLEPRAFDWVSGACFAVRRQVFDQIGSLDEGFFLYFEETDFCLRAQRAGWSCRLVPQARVMHAEGASTGIKMPRRRRPAYWYDSRRRFFLKAYGVTGLLLADLLFSMGRLSLVTRRMLGLGGRGAQADEPRNLWGDLVVGDLRALMSGESSRVRAGTRRASAI